MSKRTGKRILKVLLIIVLFGHVFLLYMMPEGSWLRTMGVIANGVFLGWGGRFVLDKINNLKSI